jgi:hypothetical protein
MPFKASFRVPPFPAIVQRLKEWCMAAENLLDENLLGLNDNACTQVEIDHAP